MSTTSEPIFVDRIARATDYADLDSNQLRVSNIFYTIQGEGPFAGRPATFVRMAGCNLGGKSVNGPGCPFCVVGSTSIRMADGSDKPIDEVKVGERVVAYDERNDAFVDSVVDQVHSRQANELLALSLDNRKHLGGVIYVTPEHPFYESKRGFVEAQELGEGSYVSCLVEHDEGDVDARLDLRLDWPREYRQGEPDWDLLFGPGEQVVYNLTVQDYSTFIANGYVVHNCDTNFKLDESTTYTTDGIIDEIFSKNPHLDDFHEGRGELIVLSGGEPLLQKNLSRLIAHIKQRWNRVDIQIETNGTQPVDENQSYLVVSPKVAEVAGKRLGYGKLPSSVYERADCLKLLVSADPDSPYHHLPAYTHEFALSGRPVYLSPINVYTDEPEGTPSLFNEKVFDHEACHRNHVYAAQLCRVYGYRLSVQQHLLCAIE
jgi:organic radical activating enzyme